MYIEILTEIKSQYNDEKKNLSTGIAEKQYNS